MLAWRIDGLLFFLVGLIPFVCNRWCQKARYERPGVFFWGDVPPQSNPAPERRPPTMMNCFTSLLDALAGYLEAAQASCLMDGNHSNAWKKLGHDSHGDNWRSMENRDENLKTGTWRLEHASNHGSKLHPLDGKQVSQRMYSMAYQKSMWLVPRTSSDMHWLPSSISCVSRTLRTKKPALLFLMAVFGGASQGKKASNKTSNLSNNTLKITQTKRHQKNSEQKQKSCFTPDRFPLWEAKRNKVH